MSLITESGSTELSADTVVPETTVTTPVEPATSTAPVFTAAQVGISFLHTPTGRTFGIALAPGVIPLADGGATSVFVVEQIAGVWGLCIGDGAEIIIGVNAAALNGGTVANYISTKIVPIANEYFAVSVFPASTTTPPTPGVLTDAEAVAEILTGLAKLTVTSSATPPVFSLAVGAVTD